MLTRRLQIYFAAAIAASAGALFAFEEKSESAEFSRIVQMPADAQPSANSAGSPSIRERMAAAEPSDTDPPGTVRLVGAVTDIGTKYTWLVPPIPFPPFYRWHKWLKDHRVSVHCALEWKDSAGKWQYGEMRSSKWDGCGTNHRVGIGQFPTTGYIAYGVYIFPGRYPRTIDQLGRPVEVTIDEVVKCDYHTVDYEIRKYAAYGKRPGDPGTGGYGKENVGLGGPGYKPAQNSNTMISYVLKKCGVDRAMPDRAVGWGREPTFPYSTNARFPTYDNQP